MTYAILLDHLQTERNYYAVTDFGDLNYCRSIRIDDGTYVLLSKARYKTGSSESTALYTVQGQPEPGVIIEITERP